MNFKTTYLLFGFLGLLMAAFFLSLYLGPNPGNPSAYVLPSAHERDKNVSPEEIDRLEIERKGKETLVFVRDKDKNRWQMTQPLQARVSGSLVTSAVREVLDARRDEKADMTTNLAQWGLENPTATITLNKGDRQWWLRLGDESPGSATNTMVYALSSDRPKEPVAVRKSDVDTLFKSVTAFRGRDLLAESAFDVEAVKVQLGKGEPVALEKGSDARWTFKQPDYGPADSDGDPNARPPVPGVRGLLDAVVALKVEYKDDKDNGFVADGVTDFAKYGLDSSNPDLLRVEVKRKADGSLRAAGDSTPPKSVSDTLLVNVAGKEKPDDKGEYVYARLDGDKSVVKVPAKGLEAITNVAKGPDTLRDRDLVAANVASADAVDVKNESGVVKLRKAKGDAFMEDWKLYRDDSGPGQKAEFAEVDKLLKDLAAKRQVRDFPDPKNPDYSDAKLGLDKPAAEVSVWVDGIAKEEKKEEKKDDKKDAESKDEKKDAEKKDGDKKEEKKEEKKDTPPKLKSDKPTVKLLFGKKNAALGVVYVKRVAGDKETLLTVPEALLNQVTAGPLAYYDRMLPTFAAEDATKLVLERGGEVIEAVKETDKDKKETWKLVRPDNLKDRNADAQRVKDVLTQLRTLRAEKLIAEKVSAGELAQFGLNAAQVKATVTTTKDGKSEEHSYLIGRETADKNGYFGKQGQRDVVFTIGKFLLEPLQADLLDKTVLSFQPNKVKALKLTGWKDARGTFTLDLVKENNEWKARAPAEFRLDKQAPLTLLTGLAGLKAQKTVSFKGGPKDEHKLKVADGALEIEISLEDSTKPLTLTLGALDADKKNYFAMSSSNPGDVFLVWKDQFEKLRERVEYFALP